MQKGWISFHTYSQGITESKDYRSWEGAMDLISSKGYNSQAHSELDSFLIKDYEQISWSDKDFVHPQRTMRIETA